MILNARSPSFILLWRTDVRITLHNSWFRSCYCIAQRFFNVGAGETIPTRWPGHFITCQWESIKIRMANEKSEPEKIYIEWSKIVCASTHTNTNALSKQRQTKSGNCFRMRYARMEISSWNTGSTAHNMPIDLFVFCVKVSPRTQRIEEIVCSNLHCSLLQTVDRLGNNSRMLTRNTDFIMIAAPSSLPMAVTSINVCESSGPNWMDQLCGDHEWREVRDARRSAINSMDIYGWCRDRIADAKRNDLFGRRQSNYSIDVPFNVEHVALMATMLTHFKPSHLPNFISNDNLMVFSADASSVCVCVLCVIEWGRCVRATIGAETKTLANKIIDIDTEWKWAWEGFGIVKMPNNL